MNDLPSSRTLIRFGSFELDTDSRELLKQGVKVRLQEQPFQILQVLLEHPGRVVTREELQRRIWPSDTFASTTRSRSCANPWMILRKVLALLKLSPGVDIASSQR